MASDTLKVQYVRTLREDRPPEESPWDIRLSLNWTETHSAQMVACGRTDVEAFAWDGTPKTDPYCEACLRQVEALIASIQPVLAHGQRVEDRRPQHRITARPAVQDGRPGYQVEQTLTPSKHPEKPRTGCGHWWHD